MRIRRCGIFLLIMGLLFSLAGCREKEINKYSCDFFAMDTYITCQVLTDDQALAKAGLAGVEQAFLKIDRLTNRFDQSSELSAVNRNAGIAPVKVSSDVIAIVGTSLDWAEKTDGAFNILIGSAMDCWGFGTDHPHLPAEAELAEAMKKTDYHRIVLDPEKSTIFLPEKGMVLDLGGIAKGYATDQAVKALQKLGIRNALINAGGNVYAMGSRVDGTAWQVGVQDPRNPKGIKAVLAGLDVAMVSSGDYQRYFEVDGIRYHHILDPASGYPARASAGTTVIMKSSAVADILSTALFVKGPVEGIKLAESLNEVDAVMIITGDGVRFGTKDLNDYLVKK